MKRLLIALLLVLSFATPKESVAGACVCEAANKYGCYLWCEIWSPEAISAFSSAATSVISNITTSVTTVVTLIETRINPIWENGFGKSMAEKQRQTASIKTFKEGASAVTTQLYMQEQSAAAAERSVVPASITSTVTNAAMLSEMTNVVRAKTAANNAAIMADFYAKKSADPGIVIERHKPYCSQADVDRGRCERVASPTMQNADLTVNTILNPGEGQYETMADEERDASIAFVKNVVNPVPVARFGAARADSPQAQAYEAALLADQAALSLAAHSFNSLIANRTRRHQQ